MYRGNSWWSVISVIIILGVILVLVVVQDLRTPEWSDETVMIKLAQHFPDYSLSSDWVKDYPFYNTASRQLVELEYTMPVWHHPPLATILLMPLAHLTSSVYVLRGVTIACFLGALVLVYLTIRKTTKRAWWCLLPVLFFTNLYRGAIYLYHDAFMVFFFALTWYLVVDKSKWKYVVACLLVLAKTQAFLLLLPLAIKDKSWKLLLTSLALLPWLLWGAAVNHNLFWAVSHWSGVMSTAFPEWGPVFGAGVLPTLLAERLPLYLLLTVPILTAVRRYYAEACLLVIALGLYYDWLCIDYHFLTMLVALPLVMATWIDRIHVGRRLNEQGCTVVI